MLFEFYFKPIKIQDVIELTTSQRIGFVNLQATNFMNTCLPYMKNIIYVIDSYLPPMAISRNEKLQETMRVRIRLSRTHKKQKMKYTWKVEFFFE